MKDYIRFLKLMRPHAHVFALAIICMVFSSLFGASPVALIIPLIDIVISGKEIVIPANVNAPIFLRELVARVKTVLRRIKANNDSGQTLITIGDKLSIDPKKYEVLVEGKKVHLTSTEYYILKMLAEKQGWVFSREKILDLLWGDEKDVFDRTVDVHIKNLRDKLGSVGKWIKNIRGVGYKLEV